MTSEHSAAGGLDTACWRSAARLETRSIPNRQAHDASAAMIEVK
jgi:hypothetical protein